MSFFDIFRGLKKTHDDAPETVESVTEILASLRRERALAEEQLRVLGFERERALIDAQSDSEILNLDGKMDASSLTIERLDAMEPLLLERLGAASSAARRAKWAAFVDRYVPAEAHFCKTMATAIAALGALQKLREEMQIAFAAEAGVFGFPPNVLSADLLDKYKFDIERRNDAGRPRPAPTEDAQAPPPLKAPQRRPYRVPIMKAEPPRPPRKPYADTAGDGECLVVILRDGVEDPRGRQCRIGDVIALRPAAAQRLLRSGGAERADG